MADNEFQKSLEQLAQQFAMSVVEAVRKTSINELAGLDMGARTARKKPGRPKKAETAPTQPEAPAKPAKRRGRPPKAKATVNVMSTPPVEATAQPVEEPKKKRNWPKCSVKGCGKNFYGPSGKARLCYGHHLDAGGKRSPLLAARQKKAAAAATEAPKASKVATAAKKLKTAKPKAARATAARATAAPDAKPKKKRAWPTCSVDGCDKNVYMPSGARKMCYPHNLADGGKPSPLAKVNKARKKAGKPKADAPKAVKAAALKAAKKPKTIRRKKVADRPAKGSASKGMK